MSGFARLLVRILAAGLLGTTATAEASFDPPRSKTVIRAMLPPLYGPEHATPIPVTVTCAYYQSFMFKTIDGDPNWSDRDAVVHSEKAPCLPKNPGENPIGWGKFKGVKGGYLLFETGTPREHGQQGFAILDDTGRMLAMDDRIGPFESIRIEAGALVLRYRRGGSGGFGCSLYYGTATGCWGQIKAQTGLTDASAPQCRDAYEALILKYKEKYWSGLKYVWGHSASIAYNAEMRLQGRKITYAARPGPVECWPAY